MLIASVVMAWWQAVGGFGLAICSGFCFGVALNMSAYNKGWNDGANFVREHEK